MFARLLIMKRFRFSLHAFTVSFAVLFGDIRASESATLPEFRKVDLVGTLIGFELDVAVPTGGRDCDVLRFSIDSPERLRGREFSVQVGHHPRPRSPEDRKATEEYWRKNIGKQIEQTATERVLYLPEPAPWVYGCGKSHLVFKELSPSEANERTRHQPVGTGGEDESEMFPPDVFVGINSDWRRQARYWGNDLQAIDEPALFRESYHPQGSVYRFSLFRPIEMVEGRWAVFQLKVHADGDGELALKLAERGADSKPHVYRTLRKSLSKEEVNALTVPFTSPSYADLVPFRAHEHTQSVWILETVLEGHYRAVVRTTPGEKIIRTIGEQFIASFDDPDLRGRTY